jgi:hypothetical protein
MNTLRFVGRLAILLLTTMFVEGMMTLGYAFETKAYASPMSWIIQSLIFVGVVWAAAEWQLLAQSEDK